jgi:hypothetical protein
MKVKGLEFFVEENASNVTFLTYLTDIQKENQHFNQNSLQEKLTKFMEIKYFKIPIIFSLKNKLNFV